MAYTYTLQDLYNTSYGIIAQWQDATAYPTSLLLSFINKAQNDIAYWNVVNLSTNERLVKQSLTFLEKTAFYTTHNYSTLDEDAVVWATTLSCTNTFSTSGYLWILGNIISYTGNDGTTISGIPTTGDNAIQFAFTGWMQVFQINTLPTDFWQLERAFLTVQNSYRQQLIGVDSRDLVNPNPTSYLYQFFNTYNNYSGIGKEYYYSMIKGQYLLFLVAQLDWQPISIDYQKRPTQLVNTTDTLSIPDDYALNTIPYMAVSEMLANRGELEEAMKLNNFGFQNIKSMYEFYASQRNELMYNQRVRSVSDGFIAI